VSGGNLPVEIWSRFMKAAHEGVPVAGLPVGTWRSAETQNPDASLTPPLNLTGSQIGTGGRGGRLPQPAPPPEAFTPQPRVAGPRGARPAEDGGLLPPAEIPNGGRGPPGHDKGLLDKLFGTL
jgi:penicillin-binding protein 1A